MVFRSLCWAPQGKECSAGNSGMLLGCSLLNGVQLLEVIPVPFLPLCPEGSWKFR